MRRLVRDQGLSLFFGAIFLLSLAGQAVAGFNLYNDEESSHGESTYFFARYVVSSHFAQATTENWQSEYLQFALFAIATVWLIQRGSTESKKPGEEGRESDEDAAGRPPCRGGRPAVGARGRLARHPLRQLAHRRHDADLALVVVRAERERVVGVQRRAAGARREHRQLAGLRHGQRLLVTTLQNWQSEFLAVGSFAAFTIYLRQRGSPQSKPVGAAHGDTGIEG